MLLLTHGFPRWDNDPTAPFIKTLAEGIVDAGNEVHVLTPFVSGFKSTKDIFNVHVYKYIWPDRMHVLGYSKTLKADIKLRTVSYLLLPFMVVFGTLSLIRLINKQKIDAISVHWILPNGLIAYFAYLVTKTPYIISFTGSDVFLSNSNYVFKTVAKMIGEKARGFITSNTRLMKKGLSVGIRNPTKIYIPYPADTSSFRVSNRGVISLKRKLGIKGSELIVFCLGRFVYKKGFEYLIKAMPNVLQANDNVTLVIGGDGELRGELENLVNKLGISNKVIFTGVIKRDALAKYYNLADIFVVPSIIDQKGNFDGATVASVEAMACGKPLVITNVVGLENYVTNRKHAMIVTQKKPNALARAITELLDNPKLRKEMSKSNKKLVTDILNKNNIGKEYSKFIHKLT